MEIKENHDNHQYNWVMFYTETIQFVIRAIDFYLSLLGDEESELSSDPDLAALVTDDSRRELGLKRDKERTQRVREYLAEKIQGRPDAYSSVDISLSHWLVRFMKSVSYLYLAKLKTRRNIMASKPNVTASTLAVIDREITAKEELFSSSGVFKDASLLELLAKYEDSPGETTPMHVGADQPLLSVSRPRPVLIGTIEILDTELRNRCLDLFNQFQESGQADRNDTVVAEASRILENRLRTAVAIASGTTAKQLVTTAFHPDNPKLKVSDVRAEQEAVQLLFLGTFGFVRNQVQHRLLEDLPAERVLQILGWTDYLLAVILQAERTESAP